MLFSCIAVFCMATLYEGLKVLREYLIRRAHVSSQYSVAVPTTENSTSPVVQYKSVRLVKLSVVNKSAGKITN